MELDKATHSGHGIYSKIKNNKEISALTLIFAIIYGVRMFINHPWYDELYTYFSFISRGTFYSAIHWPLPNNHVGYSVLSGFLSHFGNSTIALRGVSYICAVVNIPLLYNIALKLSGCEERDEKNPLAIIASSIYAGSFLVHSLSVQGRGYTLATCCYLISLYLLTDICKKENDISVIKYIIFTLSLTLGLYTLPSSVYWVLPVCVSGGLFLILNRRYGEFIKLFVFAIIAAILTLFLYAVIWLAIGSNLLSKDISSAYFGIYQLEIIKNAPLSALKTGISYMLATPYIQSVERATVLRELPTYLKRLFDMLYPHLGVIIIILLIITACLSLRGIIKDRKSFFPLFIFISIISLPTLFIIQSVQPYLRVSSFFAAVCALSAIYLINEIKNIVIDCRLESDESESSRIKLYEKGVRLASVIIAVLSVLTVLTPYYRAPLADRENDIYRALSGYYERNGGIESIFYTDDFQRYVIKFYFDEEPDEKPLGEAKVVLVSADLYNEEKKDTVWPMLYNCGDFDFDTLNNEYDFENFSDRYESYAVYQKK